MAHAFVSRLGAIVLTGRDFLVALIFVSGYVYLSYRTTVPSLADKDFFHYIGMIGRPFDFSAVPAPFVLRQIPSLVATAIYKTGLHYDMQTVAGLAGWKDDDQRRLLAMIASNAIAVMCAITVLFGYLRRRLPELGVLELFSVIGIFATWFWFSIYFIGPLTNGWGWFAATLLAIGFLERSVLMTCIAAAVAMFTRETVIVYAVGLYGMAMLLYGRSARDLIVPTLCLVLAGGLYAVLRRSVASGYEYQISPAFFMRSLFSLHGYRGMLNQFVSQISLLFLLACIAVKDWRVALCLFGGTVALTVVSYATQVSDQGIVNGECMPLVAACLVLLYRGAGLWRDGAARPVPCVAGDPVRKARPAG